MSDDPAGDYEVLRTQTAQMLNLDLAALSPTEALRVDLTALLRLQLDALQGAALAGREIDLGKLQSCYGMLSKLMPQAVAAPQVREDHSARARLLALIEAQAEVIDLDRDERIAELEARLAAQAQVIADKDATILALGGSLSAPQAASTSNQPPPPNASPPAHYLAQHNEPWRRYVQPDGSISSRGHGGKYWGPV